MPLPVIFSDNNLKAILPAGFTSTVGEPSTARAGDIAMYTGNWYAARSVNGGATWSHIDPFSYFPPADGGFCCDQTLIYDPSRDVFIWLLQYVVSQAAGRNTLRVAVCRPADVETDGWVFWDLVPDEVDAQWSNQWFDYNHAAVSDNFVYVGTNMFTVGANGFTQSVVFRLSLDELTANADLTLDFFESPDFSLRCTLGATGTMYFGAHINTSRMRVYSWAEGDANVNAVEVDVTAWSGPPYAASHTGSGNWMRRGDDRITAAWTNGAELGFLWTANSQGDARPLPFARAVRLDAATLTLIDEPDIWHSRLAFGWPEACPNSRGDLAVSLFVGGSDLHPSHAVGLRSSADPVWRLRLTTRGTDSPADGKWGDYLHMRPNHPDGLSWVTSAFTLQGGGSLNHIEPHFVHFGLDADRPTVFGGGAPIA